MNERFCMGCFQDKRVGEFRGFATICKQCEAERLAAGVDDDYDYSDFDDRNEG